MRRKYSKKNFINKINFLPRSGASGQRSSCFICAAKVAAAAPAASAKSRPVDA